MTTIVTLQIPNSREAGVFVKEGFTLLNAINAQLNKLLRSGVITRRSQQLNGNFFHHEIEIADGFTPEDVRKAIHELLNQIPDSNFV